MRQEEKDRPMVKAAEAVKSHPGEFDSTPDSELLCNPGQLTLNKMFTFGH